MKKELVRLAVRKAHQSLCHHKVSAIGLNKRGEVIGTAINRPRFSRYGGGIHAEMQLMRSCGPGLRTIIICRIGGSGALRPIHPCAKCLEKATEHNIKILTILEDI